MKRTMQPFPDPSSSGYKHLRGHSIIFYKATLNMLKMPLLAPEKICTPFDILHLKFSVGKFNAGKMWTENSEYSIKINQT